jgi:hypothetical protein
VNLLSAARPSPTRETRGFASSPHDGLPFRGDCTIPTDLGLVNAISGSLMIFNDLPCGTGSFRLVDIPPFPLWTLPDSLCEEFDARSPTRA